MQVSVEPSHVILVIGITVENVEQELPALVFRDDGHRLRLNFNGIKAAGFGTVIFNAALLYFLKIEQVNGIYPDEEENEFEHVKILQLAVLNGKCEQITKPLNGEGAFCGGHRAYLKSAEQIERGHFIIDGLVENGTDVAQVYIPGVF